MQIHRQYKEIQEPILASMIIVAGLLSLDSSGIDFDRAQFDISNEAWLQFQNGEIDANLYGIPGRYSGMGSILAKLCADLCCILGTEYTVTQYPPVLEYLFDDKAIPVDLIDQLNAISELMKTIDAETLSELQDIYDNTPEIQMTQSLSGR